MKILDRIVIGGLVPMQGDYVTVTTALAIKDKVKLSSDELAAISLVSDEKTGNLTWDAEKDPQKDVEFAPSEVALIVKTLKKIEGEAQLTADMIGVYEQFVNKEKPADGSA